MLMSCCHLAAIFCAVILFRNAEGLLTSQHQKRHRRVCTSIAATVTTDDVAIIRPESGDCYYRRIDGSWKPRKELSRLFIGERLFATRLPSCDFLEGKTGPKVFLECGVGKKSKGNKWNIVNGMLRIPTGKKGMKPSVIRKKVNKIPSDTLIEVFVSRIGLEHGSFEVCLSREDALSSCKEKKVPASGLIPGAQLTGVVNKIVPYGIFVDVGANRKGLLHISKVAKAQNRYINKEEGLKSAGLTRGSRVKVVVLSNEKKCLELDLYVAVKEPYPEESSDNTSIDLNESEEALAWEAYNNESNDDISGEEADMWAAYAAYENAVEEEDDDDYYDEDEEIEDALGIGHY
jgi:predicted RNA-binding protein with RPS1 domain